MSFKIEITKGRGPGGQYKNKTETWVTHKETGITCQDTRSKNQNLKLAKSKISQRLSILRQRELNKNTNASRKTQINNGDRTNKRRTYNLQTNTVIDHTTGKRADLKQALGGKLELLR